MNDEHLTIPLSGSDMEDSTRSDTIPYLVIHWPDGRIQRHVLVAEVTRIGRRPKENDLVLPAEYNTVSSHHAEIRRVGDTFEITDLGSANGTFVNGEQISTTVQLEHGDEICIGSEAHGHMVRLLVHTGEEIPTGMKPPKVSDQEIPAVAQPPSATMAGEEAYLSVRWPSGEEIHFVLEKDVSMLGRSPEADLIFPQTLQFVSNRHAEIMRIPDGFQITDLNSTNGTRVNNHLISGPVLLHHGDVIRIGDERFGASIGLTFNQPTEEAVPFRGYTLMGYVTGLEQIERTNIGRDPSCQIVLDSPNVSRRHAVIERYNGDHLIRDLGSANGTFVNGQLITQTVLNVGDVVQIGSHMLVYDGQTLSRFDSHGMRMDVVDVYKEVRTPSGPLRILDDISLTIMPREFVALIGGSGAGKSTLMDALNGFRPANGTILLNGQDFYRNYDNYRTQLGYVPQYDILHTSLSVESALDYAARLRLPPDITPQERKQRIGEVLETVGMNTEKIRQTRISSLSGGQRKRVSIAAELLAEPKLFFLDEPTSGLDPGLEKKMMYTMRAMADEGRTILLITHATSNIVQVDHVAFLSQGKLVYFGPPQETCDFFEVDEFADVYEKIERHGDEWREIFTARKPSLFQRFILGRQQTRGALTPGAAGAKPTALDLGQMFRQFAVFTQRMVNILFGERLSLAVLLAIMPLIAIFLILLSKPDVLTGDEFIRRDPEAAAETMTEAYTPTKDAQTTLFIMSLAAVLLGLFGASNELVNERSVYLRERMVNLKLPPYVFSKVVVFAVFAAIQCMLLLIVLALKLYYPAQGQLLPGPLEIYITLFMATMASIAMGLFISAISSSSTMVIYMILILLFVQIIFSGAIFELREKPIEPISWLTVAHWSLVGLGTTADMNRLASYTIVCGDEMEIDEGSIEVDPDSIEVDTRNIEVDEDSIQVNTDNIEVNPDSITVDPMTGEVDTSNIEVNPNSIEVDTSHIEVNTDSIDVNTDNVEVNTDNVEMRETGGTECTHQPIDPEDMTVAYGASFGDVLGVWVILALFGAVFTGLTFVALKRMDRT